MADEFCDNPPYAPVKFDYNEEVMLSHHFASHLNRRVDAAKQVVPGIDVKAVIEAEVRRLAAEVVVIVYELAGYEVNHLSVNFQPPDRIHARARPPKSCDVSDIGDTHGHQPGAQIRSMRVIAANRRSKPRR